MIKSSGSRISPTELEEVVYGSGLVGEAVALGIPHPRLGQGIVIAATPKDDGVLDCDGVIAACRETLPAYMVPHVVVARDKLARNPNGKIDRKALATELSGTFEADAL
jgi:acyl-CoA synthetase (AMP-forming)/AMP-acid ligase II